MDIKNAIEIASNKLNEIYRSKLYNIVILENSITKFEYGWVVPFQTEEYIKTKNRSSMLLGVGPLIIDEESEVVYTTGSAPIDWIDDFCKYKKGQPHKISWDTNYPTATNSPKL